MSTISKTTTTQALSVFKLVAAKRLPNGDYLLTSYLDMTEKDWKQFIESTVSENAPEKPVGHVIPEEMWDKAKELGAEGDDFEALYALLEHHQAEEGLISVVLQIMEYKKKPMEIVCQKMMDYTPEMIEKIIMCETPEVYFMAHI